MGDLLVSRHGTLIPIESLSQLNEITTVYNLRVANHHTYFVGGALWVWDVRVHNANYKWLLQHDPNAPIHVKAQSLRNDLLEFAKNKIVGYRKDGRAIYMHQDVTSAVGVATRQDGVQELLASSSRGGRLLDEVANIIGNATWVSGGRRSAGSRKLLRHAEQRLFREVDNSDNYKGLENLYPTRKPCNGAGGCQSEIAARSNLGFGDFDSF